MLKQIHYDYRVLDADHAPKAPIQPIKLNASLYPLPYDTLMQREELHVDCTAHVGDEGNDLFAHQIFERIEPFARADLGGLGNEV